MWSATSRAQLPGSAACCGAAAGAWSRCPSMRVARQKGGLGTELLVGPTYGREPVSGDEKGLL